MNKKVTYPLIHHCDIDNRIVIIEEYEDGEFIAIIDGLQQKIKNQVISDKHTFTILANSHISILKCMNELKKMYNNYLKEPSTSLSSLELEISN